MSEMFAKVLAALANIEMAKLIAWLSKWLSDWIAGLRQKQVDQNNVKKEQEAIKGGKQDEIAQAGEDVLNGVNRP